MRDAITEAELEMMSEQIKCLESQCEVTHNALLRERIRGDGFRLALLKLAPLLRGIRDSSSDPISRGAATAGLALMRQADLEVES